LLYAASNQIDFMCTFNVRTAVAYDENFTGQNFLLALQLVTIA